jgi:hypothetical protein
MGQTAGLFRLGKLMTLFMAAQCLPTMSQLNALIADLHTLCVSGRVSAIKPSLNQLVPLVH